MVNLKGELVTLRGLEPDDLDCLYLWENDAALWPYGSTRAPMTRHNIWQYIENYDGDIFAQKQLRMMITDNATSQPAGTIDIYDFDPRDGHAMTGIFIAERYRLRGYASEAIMLAAEYAREVVGMHQLAAIVCVDNLASIKLFHKCGFKSKACLESWIKHGQRYHNAIIFQKLFE